jgi:hypothetical protein
LQEVDDSNLPLNTAMLYHAIMLLSLTDPFRLAEGEVSLLFDVLLQHAGECRVIPGNQWSDSGAGLFLVDLQADAPPEPCTGLTSPAPAREPYLLDARRALENVRQRLSSTPAKVRMQSPEAMLLQRLLPEDQGSPSRRDQRFPDGRHAELLLGLESIHQYLMGEAAAHPQQAGTRPAAQDPAVACRVLDSSKGGMKLVCDGAGAGDTRVGDLLAIREGVAGARALLLAMVRSLQVQPEGGMEIGVQVMPGGMGPVSCSSPEDHEQAVHALFMPANETGGTGATLLLAKGFYEPGRHLLIDVGGREVSARAGRLVVDSPAFERFEFSAE